MSDTAGEKVEIDAAVHAKLKQYCDERGLKMGAFVSALVGRAVGAGGSRKKKRKQVENFEKRDSMNKLNERNKELWQIIESTIHTINELNEFQ